MLVNLVTGLEKVHFQILVDNVGCPTVHEALTMPPKQVVTVGIADNMNRATVKFEILAIGTEKDHLRQLCPTVMQQRA